MANKVPPPQSNAGPGCWQCAVCGLIVGDDKDECGRCAGTFGTDTGSNEGAEESENASLAEF